jgi:hypothetical protein
MTTRFGLLVHTESRPGVLHELTGVIARHAGDITSVEIIAGASGGPPAVGAEARTYFEIELPEDSDAARDALRASLLALPLVRGVALVSTLQAIYGKRVIIMGGGAQVGQVAIGAISEADRHNIRGSASPWTRSRSSGSGRSPTRCAPSPASRAPRRSSSPARSWGATSSARCARCARRGCSS